MGTSGNFQAFERGFDDHLGGELHAGRLQVHLLERGFCIAAQAGVKIVRGTFEEQPPDERQHGIADPAVFPGHRAGRNGATAHRQPAAHDEFVTSLKFFDEAVDVGKIIAIIGVAHNDPFAGSGAGAADKRAAIALGFDRHQSHTGSFCNGL